MPPTFVPDPENPDSDYLQPDRARKYYIPRTKSKWQHDDLHKKSVEFVWHLKGHTPIKGIGRFLVRQFKGKDGFYLEIEANATTDPRRPQDNYHALYQHHVDRIELHPESAQKGKFQFRMIA